MHSTVNMIAQLSISLGLLLLLAHVLLSMLGQKKVIPNLLKGLLTGLLSGLGWIIQWALGGIRDLIVAAFRGIFHGRPQRPNRRP